MVWKMLKYGSSKSNPITQSVITRSINMLGFPCDRKTVARDIDCLIKFGYKIVKNKGGGCYMINDEYTSTECIDIINCIKNSELPADRKLELIKKFKREAGINDYNS